ncbi:MAG: FAD-dependent oxidoreductase [Micrococcaceae bacterium]
MTAPAAQAATRPLLTPIDELPRRVDVVVMGSGCAGLTAAVVAAQGGRSVLVLEKAAQLGGTTAAGGGVMWAPANPLMERHGHSDTPEAGKQYLRAATAGAMSEEEINWYVETSAEAVRFLDERTRVDYLPLNRPDYHREWPGSTASGRGLDHRPVDPSDVPGLRGAVRSSTYFPLITMDERDQLHGAAPDPALLQSRAEAGVRTMGAALLSALAASAWDAGVTLSTRAAVTGLEREGDSWAVTHGGGVVHADDVVVASGGFEWSEQLRGTLLKFPITPISAPSNEGDGLKLGVGAGAALAQTTAIWGVPVLTAHGATYDGKPSGRMGNVEATLPGSIVVNSAGQRFVNEALNYHDFSRVFANIDPATSTFANIPAYLVVDSGYAARYPIAGHAPFTDPAEAPSWLVQAPTVAELAAKLDVDVEGLEDTVRRFNDGARDGTDPDFGRGATEQDRHLGDPAIEPNPCLAPLQDGPYYAVQLHPGVLGTAGGLQADLQGRVLDWQGEAIPGLYAAGNCSATVFKDAYPGGGATIGSAITRAYAVGRSLVQ